jgi:radical SAM-linked protein
MQQCTIIFSKTEAMRFISHLDLMRLFMRAMRRADLPIKLSEGFSPHPKLSFKKALKLGHESENEEASFTLKYFMPEQQVKEQLTAQLPKGIGIRELWIKRY